MTVSILTGLESSLVNTFGSTILVALLIILLFTVAFLIIQVDFRIIMLIDTILIIGFSRTGWIPNYVEGIMWIGVVGFGLYIGWTYITSR